MGETWFKLGEPKPPNMAARERVEALTIYDSRHTETVLSSKGTATVLSSGAGAVFTVIATVALVITICFLR